jgi:Zn-finger nucleic acid-binding protein
MKCPRCGVEMNQEEKDTSSGRDVRTYYCGRCRESHVVDNGEALWKVMSEGRNTDPSR